SDVCSSDLILQVLPECSTSHLPGIAVGIFTFGQKNDTEIQSLFKHHVDAAYRCTDTCRVTVEQYRYIFREPAYQPDLLLGQCCSRRRDNILDVGLHKRQHISISFHQVTESFTADRLPGLV